MVGGNPGTISRHPSVLQHLCWESLSYTVFVPQILWHPHYITKTNYINIVVVNSFYLWIGKIRNVLKPFNILRMF